ncbi:MAG: hydrogenase 4 subunit F [Alphaproteobacteria bacterium]|nr:hydrogenase 4 subunit F [Alphaproteobacteria bacterium]
MSALPLILAIPLAGAIALAFIADHRIGGWVNVAASLATFLASLLLLVFETPEPSAFAFIDDFNIYLVILTSFVGYTAAWFSAGYIAHEIVEGRLTPAYLRFYHAMYQVLSFAMLLALTANNIGVMWAAVELATLTTVVMVSLYRTRPSLEAAWKYFILGSVGIALALFGTILVYLAAQKAMGPGMEALTWSSLYAEAPNFEPELLNLAFVFLLVGYGTKTGLVPLHAWLPDAHAEGPTPISAVLSGLLLNVALYAIVRFKMLLAANGDALAPGPLLIVMGLTSLFVAALMLYRRRDIKRLFAYSSIEHMGVITFAFGMGGPLANFAGLLHMALHSLTKSAIFYAVGLASQARGTQQLERIRGLTASHPALGWALVAGTVAISGLPPFGLFMSEFVLISSTFPRAPVLGVLLLIGLLIAFGGLMLSLHGIAFGAAERDHRPLAGSLIPLYAHLVLILIAGVFLPGPLVAWFQAVAEGLR